MTNLEEFENTEIHYDQTSCVDPYLLIAQIKKYPVLFDSHLSQFNNPVFKKRIWEKIITAVFPNYYELSEKTQEVIGKTVRRRWKSLRDSVVKDHRYRLKNGERAKKRKMTQLHQELQFIVPHIRYNRKSSRSNNRKDSPDFCKLLNDDTIDLTFHEEDSEDSNVQIDDEDQMVVQNEALYPSVRLITPEPESQDIEQMKEELCFPNENAFSFPSTELNYTSREYEDEETKYGDEETHYEDEETKYEDEEPKYEEEEQNYTVNEDQRAQKRKYTDLEGDLHLKVENIIDRYNDESQDEDRMFLLSLLSDFKRVPIQKKLKVKSIFVTALCDALNSRKK